MGLHSEGVCTEQNGSGEVGQPILLCAFEQDRRDGEHNTTRVGVEKESIPGLRDGGSLSILGRKLHKMRKRGKPTRLEIHRLKYNQSGRRGPLLKMAELSEFEKNLISQEVLQDVRVKRIDFTGDLDEQIFDDVQFGVLSEWGVMCPHNNIEKATHKLAVVCTTCGCLKTVWDPEIKSVLIEKIK